MAVSDAPDRPKYDPAVDAEFPPPNLGRSVHVVGTVVNVRLGPRRVRVRAER